MQYEPPQCPTAHDDLPPTQVGALEAKLKKVAKLAKDKGDDHAQAAAQNAGAVRAQPLETSRRRTHFPDMALDALWWDPASILDMSDVRNRLRRRLRRWRGK